MTQKDINNWIMYHEIQRLSLMGFSRARIARYLVMDARTISKYLCMSEAEYEHFLERAEQRNKLLSPYEEFVKTKLKEYPETSSAQIYDWLKEHHRSLPEVSPRTVYNFVMFVRQKYEIPCIGSVREYFPVEELPYGRQAQVDFGEYNMRMTNGKRKKVKFFVMVLSRSRMKYVYFLDQPFTAKTVVLAHEQAFAFFGGIPQTIVYDQDRTMVVDENIGDIILTSVFKSYTKSRSFDLHFCRKADPESKGKVENVVQYVKKNFLYNRVYIEIEAINMETLAWLGRTANALPHNYTKKIPMQEFITEQQSLIPYIPIAPKEEKPKAYQVRKTNVIAYKSNFYSLPVGTYKGADTQVLVSETQGEISLYDHDNNLVCKHTISGEKGKTIINTNHRRDTSKSIREMMEKASACFSDKILAMGYLQKIKQNYPRYIRDHLQLILKTVERLNADKKLMDKTLDFSLKNNLYSANEFEQTMYVLEDLVVKNKPKPNRQIKLIGNETTDKANEMPQRSNIADYENIVNKT